MDSTYKDGSCYIDGVPMKISNKFLPPKPVSLPLPLDTKGTSDLLALEYDFSLERNVVEFIQKRQTELLEKKTTQINASSNPQENEPKNALKPNTQQYVLPWQSDSILQPKQQQPPDKDQNPSAQNDNIKINLSDFENDTSSPFDYMELQTINDLEELNSVFQGIHIESSVETTAVAEENSVEAVPSDNALNVAKSVSFPLPQNSPSEPTVISSSLSEDFTKQPYQSNDVDDTSYVAKSISFPLPQTNSVSNASSLKEDFTKRPSLRHALDDASFMYPSANLKEMRGFSCDNSNYSTLSQVPYISSSNIASQAAKSLRGSKSYSDIHCLPGTESHNLVKERSRTPPTSYSEVIESPVQELPLNEEYFGRESSNGVSDCDMSAYYELDEDSRHFVDSITEMGFIKSQVARAVKHLGMDEKAVVEHLCQIQILEESGYDGSEAEAALHLHDYNREQAKAFLDLVSRFQDLGFEKDAVKKALVQNKNDWNKTIDALLT